VTLIPKSINPNTIAQHERRAKAVRLRSLRRTYQQIADECGYYDRHSARRAVQEAMSDIIREPTEELISLELMFLDEIMKPMTLKALKGDVQAAVILLRYTERKHRLLGLDAAPTKDESKITEVLIDSSILGAKTDVHEFVLVDTDAT
jgi:hypothetical protein